MHWFSWSFSQSASACFRRKCGGKAWYSLSRRGSVRKYFARVWIVEMPGNSVSEKQSRMVPMPSSSTTSETWRRSMTVLTFSRCSDEKSIQPSTE